MLGLPKSTDFNKRIPKKKFYEKLSVSPEVKRLFVDQVKTITWKNKIAASTVNLEEGKNVTEIEVIEIVLNGEDLDEKVLRLLDQGIPYHIIFVIRKNDKAQLATSYKEKSKVSGNPFKVGSYYRSNWLTDTEMDIELTGLNLDQAYESIVRSIAGERIVKSENETLQESVERTNEINKVKAKIQKQQSKIRKEKQFNKKVALNNELKLLNRKLQELENGKNEDGVC